MRILWLKSDLLLPLDKGGKLRTWHLMRQLARPTIVSVTSGSSARTSGSTSRQKKTIASSFGSQSIEPVKTSAREAAGLAAAIPPEGGAKNVVSTPVGTT
jgi:hypothetical protein